MPDRAAPTSPLHWPAPGPGPALLVHQPEVVPAPVPAPHAILANTPYPIEETHDERIDADALEHIEELVAINEDSRRRLEHGAESVDDMLVASLLRDVARERGIHARELEPHMLAHGIDSTRSRDGRRPLHRLWLGLRRLVRRPDTERVLRQCERDESEVEAAYDAALAVLPRGRVRDMVSRQRGRVHAAHRRLTATLA